MRVGIDQKDLVKYPFLKEAQKFGNEFSGPLDEFLKSPAGVQALAGAMERIQSALGPLRALEDSTGPESPRLPSDRARVQRALASYAIARVIVSCMKDRPLIDRLARWEAQRSSAFLDDEEQDKKSYIAASLGLALPAKTVPLAGYIELAAGLREDKWRLVNRELVTGAVAVRPEEFSELIRERIRVVIAGQLPLNVPEQICTLCASAVRTVCAAHQQQMLAQFGVVDESSFPPCIQALITALAAGTNISHPGRFALTAFLHTIGMDTDGIIGLFGRAPDFDIEKTLYQVQHIAGRGGTEYTAPACAAMRTTGVCVRRDRICERVNHPLNYYRYKKKYRNPESSVTGEKFGSGGENAGTQPGGDSGT